MANDKYLTLLMNKARVARSRVLHEEENRLCTPELEYLQGYADALAEAVALCVNVTAVTAAEALMQANKTDRE